MTMKMREVEYNAPAKQILAIPDHYVALGFKHAKAAAGTEGLAVLVDGHYIVKAGTVYPSNDANAIGLVLNDYDVTYGDQMMAVVVHGFIKKAALPVLPAAAAITAMKQITFNPLIDMAVTLEVDGIAIAAGEALNTEHTFRIGINNATFRAEAATEANWTVVGEAATKVAIDSITVDADGRYVTVVTKNSAAAVAGTVTMVPKAACTSTGQVPTGAKTVVTVA